MSISDEESKDSTDQTLTIHFVTYQFEEEGVSQKYYNQVVMSAQDLEIIKRTGGNVPQSKREVLNLIIEKQNGETITTNNFFR